ncbi:hypothetical protein JST97_25405 [bacterium]|nr:hypothetical protein [bacterium]
MGVILCYTEAVKNKEPFELLELDLDTPLEQSLSTLSSWITLGLLMFSCMVLANGGKNGPPLFPNFHLGACFGSSLLVTLLARLVRKHVDVRYQVNPRLGQLLLVRSFFGQAFRFPVVELAEIQCVAWSGRYMEVKGRGAVWEYALFLVTKRARMIQVSSWSEAMNSKLQKQVAETLGVEAPPYKQDGQLAASVDPVAGLSLKYGMPWDRGLFGCLYIPLFFGLSWLLCWLFSY